MTDDGIKKQIEKKRKEIDKLRNGSSRWILEIVLYGIGAAVCIFLYFFLLPGLISLQGYGFLRFVIICAGTILLGSMLGTIIKFIDIKINGPKKIANLENEIEELNSLLSNNNTENEQSKDNKTAQASIESLDVLLRYKELLDQNIITQEEFEAKKREILSGK